MGETIEKAKMTCPMCSSVLGKGIVKDDGVEISVKHCESCDWWG